MTMKTFIYAYLLGGFTFLPLIIVGIVSYTIFTSVPATDSCPRIKTKYEDGGSTEGGTDEFTAETNDLPKPRRGWLTMRRTFQETALDGGYVNLVRSFLDARSKDPKRSRPKDMWFVVLKGKVLYLYEDEQMTECEAAIELGSRDIIVYPEGLLDGELFTKRNAICLRPKVSKLHKATNSQEKDRVEEGTKKEVTELDPPISFGPWFMFLRTTSDMEDWYFALIHASEQPSQTPIFATLQSVFQPSDMDHLVTTLDEQPDVIPTRWLNALLGRVFFSFYKTRMLEEYIIGRLMKKLSKVKRPTFLTDIVVTEVFVGNSAPTFSKPMLKELTKEGVGAMEVHLHYKGEFSITIQATAILSIGSFKSYNVKLVLAVILKELEGNLLIKVKRPPSNRIWYAFTQMPRIVLSIEPIVSDRQITWSMILGPLESRLKEIIQDSIVMPHMDDIAFFDSSEYRHRGGIWKDAARRETHDSTLSAQEKVANEDQPYPVVDLSLVGESAEGTHAFYPSKDPAEDGPTDPSVLHDISESRRNNDVSQQPTGDLPGIEESEQRGRSTQSDGILTASSRPHSTPGKTESRIFDFADNQNQTERQHMDFSVPGSPVLRKRSGGSRSSLDFSFDSVDDSETACRNSATSSTSTFLSSLKSRAGDKQALSNTAKEAMRKWGVNWGSLKKDLSGDGDHGSTKSTLGAKLLSDNVSTLGHKAKTSYADVKAAVAERRAKDRPHKSDDLHGDLDGSWFPAPVMQKDISISNASEGQSSIDSLPSDFDNLAVSSTSSQERRLSTGSSTSRKSSSTGYVDDDGQDVLDSSQPMIVHVQPPKATMMTIPGIHASHRGEVMSLGYNAPPKVPVTVSDGKSTIQTVYRLWKSPPSSDARTPMEPMSTSDSECIQIQACETEDKDADPLNLSPQSSSPPVLVPPPLPPRPTPPPAAISRSLAGPTLAEPMSSSATQKLRTIASSSDVQQTTVENYSESLNGVENLDLAPPSSANKNAPLLPPRSLPAQPR